MKEKIKRNSLKVPGRYEQIGHIYYEWYLTGKTSGFDHPSPEYDNLFKHQNTRPFALSIRIGPKWSRGPFFPVKGIGFSNLANKLNVK